jgi:hypothetical protein
MSTIWKNTKTNNTFTGKTLSSWSRQQKLAMIACLAILAILLAVSACSKQSEKTALVGISGPANAQGSAIMPQTMTQPTVASADPGLGTTPAKKAARKRPANVTYADANSGVSFLYPRKFPLSTGDKAQPQFDSDAVPMNFVDGGGTAIATVALPRNSYPGTDFSNAFFSVNVNRSIPEAECRHFAYLDTSDADGEPIDAQKVEVGSTEMEKTSEFAGNAMKQAEAQYYHHYENGACYEYVLGLGTAGYPTTEGIKPVDRDEVFARLEKILATVKVKASVQEKAQDTQTPQADDQTAGEPAAAGDSSN